MTNYVVARIIFEMYAPITNVITFNNDLDFKLGITPNNLGNFVIQMTIGMRLNLFFFAKVPNDVVEMVDSQSHNA